MSTHVGPRPIWVVRCGDYDRSGDLSAEGHRFAAALSEFVTSRIADMRAQVRSRSGWRVLLMW